MFVQKYLAGIALLAITFDLCYSGCMLPRPLEVGEEPLRGCEFEGKLHKLDSTWRTPNCAECTCGESGEICCNSLLPAFVSENCNVVIDQTTCQYKVFSKTDSSIPCTVRRTGK
nr:PREDICTED: beta-microseminoprotein [Latimeria chalumnae]|eukprot:XP_014343445.1 PREDICTED: beta-microseminoprotein [Latimeria chalumnae]